MPAKLTTEQFINKSNLKHDYRYDYSLVEYQNAHTKVNIICKEHGVFEQTPTVHLSGSGCPSCKKDKLRRIYSDTLEIFIDKSLKMHGTMYDYSKCVYKGSANDVTIICPIHGEFNQRPNFHIRGHGCPSCGIERMVDKQSITEDEYIKRANEKHDGKYSYCNFTEMKNDVTVICPAHSEYRQNAYYHLKSIGCKSCNNNGRSSAEDELYDYVSGLTAVSRNRRDIISPKELDIVLDDYKIAIEYNGLYWHSSDDIHDIENRNRHIEKTILCDKVGYRLIHVFEDEYENKERVHSNILQALKINMINAYDCEIREISYSMANDFMNTDFVYERSYALYHEGVIIQVMYINGDDVRFTSKSYVYVKHGIKRLSDLLTSSTVTISRHNDNIDEYIEAGYEPIDCTLPNMRIVNRNRYLYDCGDIILRKSTN